MSPRLSRLLQGLPGLLQAPGQDLPIRSVVSDSRRLAPGDLFVALRGRRVDGHAFLGEASSRGAAAAVVEEAPSTPPLPLVVVRSTRAALGRLASAAHGHPSHRLVVVGVTGTDGKTTTASLIHHLLEQAGRGAGLISTVEARLGAERVETGAHVSTPLAEDLQLYLGRMVRAGLSHAVLEATSHGLEQGRLEGVAVDLALLTNVTHEHLDYHLSWETYREAKARLFQMLAGSQRKGGQRKASVLNRLDPSYDYFAAIAADEVWSYGLEAAAPPPAVVGQRLQVGPAGLRLEAHTPAGRLSLESPLVGEHNAHNLLGAVATGLALGLEPASIEEGVSRFQGVPGRMETLELGAPFRVVVDFAHTPVSLERALSALRSLTPGRLRVVFGCAGLRDRQKRPLMGAVAARLADEAFLTAEDPRTEDLAQILEEIAAGCREAGGVEGASFFRVPDRMEAIRLALARSREGDTVVLAGKGHEPTMCFGEEERPWSEHQAARQAWASL